MSLTQKEDSEIIAQAIEHIIVTNDGKTKLSKIDSTVLYITSIITTMGTAKKPHELFKVLSPEVKETFDEIGAHEYAEVFGSTFSSAMEEVSKLSGPFTKRKRMKILNSHAVALYVAVETLEGETSLVSNYLVPYIQKHYSKFFNN